MPSDRKDIGILQFWLNPKKSERICGFSRDFAGSIFLNMPMRFLQSSILNSRGIIAAIFAVAAFFSMSVAHAETKEPQRYLIAEFGKYGFIDESGHAVIKPRYDFAHHFSEGLAAVLIGKSWGYIGPAGEIKIQPTFRQAYVFSNGRAFVTSNDNRTGFIDTSGNFITAENYAKRETSPSLPESLYASEPDENGLIGFMNLDGVPVIPPRFTDASEFSEGLAAVREKERWGYINEKGEWVLTPTYKNAAEFSDGRAAVELENGYTFIDRDGNPLFDKRYSGLGMYTADKTPAADLHSKKWGFINAAGDFVIEPRYDGPNYFFYGLTSVCIDKFCGVIDSTGKTVVPLEFARLTIPNERVISAVRWHQNYYFKSDGSLFYSPLNLRTFGMLLLYLIPFFLPIVIARHLAKRGIVRLKTLEGEEFRVVAFGLGRKIGRLRQLQILVIIALMVFGNAFQIFTSQTAETLAWFLPRILLPLGKENITPSSEWYYSLAVEIFGALIFIFLLIFCSTLTRGSWIRVEQEVFKSKLTAKKFYLAHLRGLFFSTIPFLILIALTYYFPKLASSNLLLVVVTFTIFLLSSSVLFLFSSAKSKHEAVEFKSMVEDLSKRSGISLSKIVVFEEPTGRIANAWAAGLTSKTRKILVTQALLDRCTEEELRAIVAHELGHLKHHDVLRRAIAALLVTIGVYYLISSIQSMPFSKTLPIGTWFFVWVLLGAPLIGALVGILSRRQEFAADSFAAKLVGSPEVMILALRKIHSEGGIPSTFGRFHRYFLGHPSLVDREAALRKLESPAPPASS